MRSIGEFWRGDLPLGHAFWGWGVLGGAIVCLSFSSLALALVVADAPAWLALLVFAADIPWNLILLVGVWRSAERAEVSGDTAKLARLVMVVWVVALSVL